MKYLCILMIFSFTCLASSQDEVKSASRNFLKSIFDKDLQAYKENVSESYLKQQTEIGFIKDTFQANKDTKKKLGAYDLKIKKGSVDEIYFVNFKEKRDENFSDNWLVLKLNKKGKYVVDGIHHFED